MKNLIVILLLVIHSIFANSQSYNGIEVGKDLASTKAKVLSKGFVQVKKDLKNCLVYQKYENGKKLEIYLIHTPYTKIVWKLAVFVDDATSWSRSKEKYFKYVSILTNKYGDPKTSVDEFESPYYEGDGYEIQALYLGKASIGSIFQDTNGNYITIELGSFDKGKADIIIHYENDKASKLNDKEMEKVNNNIY